MKKLEVIFITCLMAASVSCSKKNLDENESQAGLGELSVEMELSTDTKAMTDDELRRNAIVNIYKANYSGLVRFYKYSEMPAPFYLAADKYRVDVIAGESAKDEPEAASWDNKSYKGSKEFTITAGEKTPVTVEAFVNNAVTLISFDQTIQDNFNAGYTFTIGIDENTQLVYDASKSGSEGYFIVAGLDEPSFSWTFAGTLAKDGSDFVKTGEIPEILPGKRYKMNLRYTIKDGDLVFTLVVDKTTENIDDTIIFEPVSTGLSATPIYEVWATHTTFYADVDVNENAGKDVWFNYSSDNGATWSSVEGVDYAVGCWKADVTGLTPSTEYQYKLVIGGQDVGDPLTFTTEDAPKLPNGSFEHYSVVDGYKHYKFYNPSSDDPDANTKFWGSGNGDEQSGGSIMPGSVSVITDIDTEDKVHGNCSVVAQSVSAYSVLAAGNLFTGQFVEAAIGLSGQSGKVNFGRKWTVGRPRALKVYCKYITGTLDKSGTTPDGSLSSSDYDRAQIKVAIGTWSNRGYGGSAESPVQVNTADESTFIDFFDDKIDKNDNKAGGTIAYGELILYHDSYMINREVENIKTQTTSEWHEYTIPLIYNETNVYPTHIIISCASSQYGDYFIGSFSSRLKMDNFELIY